MPWGRGVGTVSIVRRNNSFQKSKRLVVYFPKNVPPFLEIEMFPFPFQKLLLVSRYKFSTTPEALNLVNENAEERLLTLKLDKALSR